MCGESRPSYHSDVGCYWFHSFSYCISKKLALSKLSWFSFSGLGDIYINPNRGWGHTNFFQFFNLNQIPLANVIRCTKYQSCIILWNLVIALHKFSINGVFKRDSVRLRSSTIPRIIWHQEAYVSSFIIIHHDIIIFTRVTVCTDGQKDEPGFHLVSSSWSFIIFIWLFVKSI